MTDEEYKEELKKYLAEKGDPGIPGPNGPDGPQGLKGNNVFCLGSEKGIKGKKGEQGHSGPDGINGWVGRTGDDGELLLSPMASGSKLDLKEKHISSVNQFINDSIYGYRIKLQLDSGDVITLNDGFIEDWEYTITTNGVSVRKSLKYL